MGRSSGRVRGRGEKHILKGVSYKEDKQKKRKYILKGVPFTHFRGNNLLKGVSFEEDNQNRKKNDKSS